MQKIGTKITVTVPDEQLHEIERIAERLQVSKAEACRKLLGIGLDTYKIYEPMGIVKFADVVRKVKSKLNITAVQNRTELKI